MDEDIENVKTEIECDDGHGAIRLSIATSRLVEKRRRDLAVVADRQGEGLGGTRRRRNKRSLF